MERNQKLSQNHESITDPIKWKKVDGKPDNINELILKTKADIKERPDTIEQSSLDYVFISIDWLSFGERGGVRLTLDVQGRGRETFWTQLDKGGEGSWKLDNFHGRHMCFVPY